MERDRAGNAIPLRGRIAVGGRLGEGEVGIGVGDEVEDEASREREAILRNVEPYLARTP